MSEPFRIQSNQPLQPTQRPNSAQPSQAQSSGSSFAEILADTQNLRFSNHAQKRLQTRNISLSDDELNRLATAVEKADKRGGKESLVLMDDLAFIVNVKNRLVVTAVDSQNRGEGVFTNIDSVVIADPTQSASTPGSATSLGTEKTA